MPAATVERKLTTIVAADVAGFSRLIAAEEEATLAALRRLRSDRIDPVIASHRGRIANTAGDSLLMEFPSVVEADWQAMELETLGQPTTITAIMEASFPNDPLYRKIFEDGLRKAGLPEG